MDDNPVQLTYKYDEDRWFDLRFNMHCRVSEWGTFREALVREGQMRGDQYFGGKLCQILLCREIEYPGARKDEMWFKVGGKPMRFGKEGFLLCTGLRFGPLPLGIVSHYPASNDGVEQRYFGKRRIHINKVKLKLEEGNFTRDDDMMKLAYVFFAAHFLLGRERHRTVPGWLWGLVEDLVAFENFPWGTYVYSSTIYWLGKVLRSRLGGRSNKQNMKEKMPAKKQNLGINIYGFPWSLMIWALEAIPSLNGKCGIRQGDGIPRVCRWYCRKKPTGLVNEFKEDLKVLTTLTASEDEMKQDYYVSFDPDQLVGPMLHKIDGFGNDSEDDDMEKDVPVEDNAEKDVSVEDNEEKDVPAEDDVDPADNVCNESEDIEIHEERQYRESKSKIQHDHLDVPRRRTEPVMVADHPTPPTVKRKKHKKQIVLRQKKICIYDSLCRGKDPKQRIKDVEPLTRFLPSMLRCGGFFDHTNIDPWVDGIDVSVVDHQLLPQQPPGVSCGAFVMKYMENIMTFKDHKWDFDGNDEKRIREEIARDIFLNSEPLN
ncbi:hypothetical protein ACOSQ4_027320 [Xanthoceras sorbifolium]